MGALSSKSNASILIFLAGIRKKAHRPMEAGPWVATLHLADNSIDGTGKDGEQLPELEQTLTWWGTVRALDSLPL